MITSCAIRQNCRHCRQLLRLTSTSTTSSSIRTSAGTRETPAPARPLTRTPEARNPPARSLDTRKHYTTPKICPERYSNSWLLAHRCVIARRPRVARAFLSPQALSTARPLLNTPTRPLYRTLVRSTRASRAFVLVGYILDGLDHRDLL